MVRNNINCIEDAKKELHLVTEEIKQMNKEFNISKRSRPIIGLKKIIKAFDMNFRTKSVKVNGLYKESKQSRYFYLIKNRYWLQGYISAKMDIGSKKIKKPNLKTKKGA